MNDFDRYASSAICNHEARKSRRYDRIVDIVFSSVVGAIAAAALLHALGALV